MGYPQLAVMNISHRYFDLEEFFSSAAASGYTCCELWTGAMHLYVDCHGYDSLEQVRELSQQYGVRIVGLCPEQNNPKPWNIAARGNEARARTLAYFKNVVDIAAELGAEQVMVSSGWAFLNEPIEDAWGRSASMLRAIAEHAGERGVRLVLEALQPAESMIVNSAADTKRMIEAVDHPALKACLDIGAMAVAGDTIDDYFDLLGDDVAHVHFVDVAADGTTHLAWGDGDRDMRADLDRLVARGYRGVVSAETYDWRYFADPALIVQVHQAEQLTQELAALHPAYVYVPVEILDSDFPRLAPFLEQGAQVAAVLPRVITDDQAEDMHAMLSRAAENGVQEALVGNMGHIFFARRAGMRVRGDFGLNVFNSFTEEVLQQAGLVSATASFELRVAQIRDLAKSIDTEMIVYGRLPCMITEQCIIRNSAGRCNCSVPNNLADRRGALFPVLPAFGHRNQIFNAHKLYLADKHEDYETAGLWGVRLMFTTETPRECVAVTQSYLGLTDYRPNGLTRGLYYRGVE